MKTALLTPEEEPDPARLLKVLQARKENGHWVVHHCFGPDADRDTAPWPGPDPAAEAVEARVRNWLRTINQYRAGLGLPPAGIQGLS